MNLAQEKEVWLTTPELSTCILIVSPQQVIAHLRAFASPRNYGPSLALNYLVITTNLDCIQRLHHELYKNVKQKALSFNVSITPLASLEEAREHISTMQKIFSDSFEDKYLQMMGKVESNIENGLVLDFCRKELKWSLEKINHVFSTSSQTQ